MVAAVASSVRRPRTTTATTRAADAADPSVIAALCSCAVTVPQEVIKQRLVAGLYPSFGAAVRTIYTSEGVGGFFQGALPTVARNVPFVALTFCAFSAGQAALLLRRQHAAPSAASSSAALTAGDSLLLGTSAATVAAFITQPIDVVKTRMMTQAVSAAAPYASALDCARTMAAAEGAGAFYRGILPRTLYMGPLWAIQFAVHAHLTRVMVDGNMRRAGLL